jgi:hypothetical protein
MAYGGREMMVFARLPEPFRFEREERASWIKAWMVIALYVLNFASFGLAAYLFWRMVA